MSVQLYNLSQSRKSSRSSQMAVRVGTVALEKKTKNHHDNKTTRQTKKKAATRQNRKSVDTFICLSTTTSVFKAVISFTSEANLNIGQTCQSGFAIFLLDEKGK